MRVLVVCDSFKGSLTSRQVAEAVERGIINAAPDAEVIALPVADGGEGTAFALASANGLDADCEAHIRCEVTGPDGNNIMADYYRLREPDGVIAAILDVASACGLTKIDPEKHDIMRASTAGVGELINQCHTAGCRRLYIGLGGSATCDGGIGMLGALGFRFLDKNGRRVAPKPQFLHLITQCVSDNLSIDLAECEFIILCDVENPLSGPAGAARVYAPQKGASPSQVTDLDKGLQQWGRILSHHSRREIADIPGSGAAGGLGAAFFGFMNGCKVSGADYILNHLGIDRIIPDMDLIITGEGKIDSQTLYGKLPIKVLERCERHGKPVIAIAGRVENRKQLLERGFADVVSIVPPAIPLSEAMQSSVAIANIESTAALFFDSWIISSC